MRVPEFEVALDRSPCPIHGLFFLHCQSMMLTTLALALPAAAGGDFSLTDEPLVGFAKRVDGTTTAYAEVEGAPNAPFLLFATPLGEDFDPLTDVPIFSGVLDVAGHASAAILVSPELADAEASSYAVNAVYLWNGQLFQPNTGQITVGTSSGAQLLDFDFAPGFDEPVPGQQIDDEYGELGLTVSAVNNTGGPNMAIVFDSTTPTGGDTDLATPGPGTGNDESLGQLLIIAENDFDADNDGLVDDPDDEQKGGVISFAFDVPTEVESVRLVDIDDQMPSEIRYVIEGVAGFTTVPVNDVGDNGVQEVLIGDGKVELLEVYFGGSGAVADILLFPCPIVVDFNETPTGRPLDLPAGTVITDQLADLGVTFSCIAGAPGLPNKCIIFDSGNPTGGDFDLATPGPGENNDTFLGNLLIIAENDIDADNDGLVDDPDDSASGGFINFDFDQNVVFFGFQVIDVDSVEIDAIRLFDEFDNVLVQADLGPIGENSVQDFDLGAGIAGVRRGEFFFSGSGGIDSIRFCPEEETPTPQ